MFGRLHANVGRHVEINCSAQSRLQAIYECTCVFQTGTKDSFPSWMSLRLRLGSEGSTSRIDYFISQCKPHHHGYFIISLRWSFVVSCLTPLDLSSCRIKISQCHTSSAREVRQTSRNSDQHHKSLWPYIDSCSPCPSQRQTAWCALNPC